MTEKKGTIFGPDTKEYSLGPMTLILGEKSGLLIGKYMNVNVEIHYKDKQNFQERLIQYIEGDVEQFRGIVEELEEVVSNIRFNGLEKTSKHFEDKKNQPLNL